MVSARRFSRAEWYAMSPQERLLLHSQAVARVVAAHRGLGEAALRSASAVRDLAVALKGNP